MATKELTKEQEIKHLEALRDGSGYFAEYFGGRDINQMIQNIKDDHGIEMWTKITTLQAEIDVAVEYGNKKEQEIRECHSQIDALLDQVKNLESECELQDAFRSKLLQELVENEATGAPTSPRKFYSWQQVLKERIRLGLLTEDDRATILELLNI